jgi:Holliday junction DNA helicase RuvA
MIGYLRGRIVARHPGMLVMEVGGVGYEIHLPGYVQYRLKDMQADEDGNVTLYTLYYHPENQSRPRLFGFRNEVEREFFEELTTVQGIGPKKALDVFAGPISKMGRAIADGDEDALTKIKGVGLPLARKIIASLKDKAAKYALLPEDAEAVAPPTLDDLKAEVVAVLTTQLGHSRTEASAMVDAALKRNPSIKTREELFDEVYRAAKD